MITFIETENFKKVGTSRVEFTSGTNLIIGDNGHGKTTLFNAVKFALYGVAGIASDKENVPTWGHKNCKVKVGFDKDFLIVRTLRDCKVYEADADGNLTEEASLKVAEGNSPCVAWVKEHYGLDSDMFDIFNMSLQGETGALITLGATKLNQVVENYSGVGVLDKVIKTISNKALTIKGASSVLEYKNTSDMLSNLEEEATCVAKLTESGDRLAAELNSLTTKRSQLSSEVSEALSSNKKIQMAKDSISETKALIDVLSGQQAEDELAKRELVSELSKTPDIEEVKRNKTKLEGQLKAFGRDSDLHTEMTEAIDQYRGEVIKFTELAKQEAIAEKELAKLEGELAAAETALTQATSDSSEAMHELLEAKETLHSGSCTKCHRPFENFNIEAAKEAVTSAESKLSTCTSKLNAAKDSKSAIESLIEGLPPLNGSAGQVEEYKSYIVDYEKRVAELEEEWQGFEDDAAQLKITSLNSVIDSHEELSRELRSVERRLANTLVKLNNAEDKFKEAGPLAKLPIVDVAGMQDKLSELHDKIDHVDTEHNEITLKLSDHKHSQSALTSAIKEAETNNDKLKSLEKELDSHSRLIKYLRSTRTDYMGGVWYSILGAASGFISKTTQGWITAIGRDSKGNFTFTENGIVATVKGDASGAQKEFIGVSLRIGLGMALQGDRALLMLDEPTAGMTEDNADKLATGLLGVSGQKIVITHRSSERLTAANIISL